MFKLLFYRPDLLLDSLQNLSLFSLFKKLYTIRPIISAKSLKICWSKFGIKKQ